MQLENGVSFPLHIASPQSIPFNGPFMGEELAPGLFLESLIFSDFQPVSQADSALQCKGAHLNLSLKLLQHFFESWLISISKDKTDVTY